MRFSEHTMIRDLLKSEAVKAVLEKHIPGFTSSPMLELAKHHSLQAIAAFGQGQITPQLVETIVKELVSIEERGILLSDQVDDERSSEDTSESEEYEIKELMVPMRDGVRLRTRICMPKTANGPVPVLISRTPYNNFENYGKWLCQMHAGRGFASVHQQCRGTFGSEGEWVPNENERQDGIDTIHWLAEQEWCRSIGIYGDSYQALTGWLIADLLPDKVKSLYLVHYSVDRFLSAYKQGLFRHDVLTGWAMTNAGTEINADYIQSALYRPHVNVDESLWGVHLDWYRKWVTSPDFDSEYWHTGVWKTLREIPARIQVPVCLVAGWYDHHLEGNLLGYEALSDEIKAKSKLVIGAWNHYKVSCVPAHCPQHSELDFEVHMMEWFERVLKEQKEPEGGVELYSVGDDKWMKVDSWPLKITNTINFYLTTIKRNDFQALKLDMGEVSEIYTVDYEYDPEQPLYSNGSESMLVSYDKIGSKLQQAPGYRDDVISFISDPLTEDIRIGGQMNVKLYVSSDCDDTCFTAKIMEVLPNGDAYNIRSTVSTLAYRNNSRTRLVYKPGDIVEVNIDLLSVVWNVKEGSCLRIDVSSSSFPEYSIHSNHSGVWSLQENTRVAHQKIYIGGPYPSRLEIPTI